MVEITELNKSKVHEFVEVLKDVFEHSPWVAERAAALRPFDSIYSLHKAMVQIVKVTSVAEKLALIISHPDLGSRVEMSDISQREQKSAGLDELSEEEYENFISLNKKYVKKFNFPFIIAVRGKTAEEIYSAMEMRIKHTGETEFEYALAEIFKIALFRLKETISDNSGQRVLKERTMTYGKGDVFAYRTYLKPLTGVKSIPESSFTGRSNVLFGLNVKAEVGGRGFLSSFTEGDNTLVVATDSMKNFIQQHLGKYQGTTAEGFLAYVAEAFLDKYPQIETVKLVGEEVPFTKANVLTNSGIAESNTVFNSSRGEKAETMIEVVRGESGNEVIAHSGGIVDLQLIKVKGNSFASFVRDEYTTLPESSNRPLFIYLNISWEYEDTEDFYSEDPLLYVASEQIKDISATVFDSMETKSIQHLIYHIGCRILERFPQLREVNFQSQNHTWDTVVETIPNSEGKVYTEPRPPFGFQRFSVTKEDLIKEVEVEMPSTTLLK